MSASLRLAHSSVLLRLDEFYIDITIPFGKQLFSILLYMDVHLVSVLKLAFSGLFMIPISLSEYMG